MLYDVALIRSESSDAPASDKRETVEQAYASRVRATTPPRLILDPLRAGADEQGSDEWHLAADATMIRAHQRDGAGARFDVVAADCLKSRRRRDALS